MNKVREKRLWEKRLSTTTQIGLGQNRPNAGFGYAIIPVDMDRQEYLRLCYNTGYILILDQHSQEVVRDVQCPLHILQELEFPTVAGQYGSLLSWINIETLNQLVVHGIHIKPGEMPFLKESSKRIQVSSRQKNSSVFLDLTPQVLISAVNDFDTEGGVTLLARNKSQSKLDVLTSGESSLYGEVSCSISSENLLIIQVGSKQGRISKITFDSSGNFKYDDFNGNSISIKDGSIEADSTLIGLGKVREKAVKGQTLKGLLSQLLDELSILTVTCTAPGSPSSPPINFAAFQAIKNALGTILSSKVEIE